MQKKIINLNSSCKCYSNYLTLNPKNEIPASVNNFKVYPNPSTGLITVENKNENYNSKLFISDITGKGIYEKEIINNQANELNPQQLENGIYLLKIINKNNTVHSKISLTK